MKVLVDIGHPAHVHLFKHFSWQMQKKGHEIFFTCREKEFEIYLLEKYGFQYKSFGRKYVSKLGKLWGLIEFDVKEFLTGLNFKPDLFISHGSIYAAHAAFFMGKPHIALEDTGNNEQVKMYLPFTKNVLTADVFPYNYYDKQIRYPSHHELAYLHPNQFQPNNIIRKELGLKSDSKIALIRFVAWNATHDFNKEGLSISEKVKIIDTLKKHNYDIYISTEDKLPFELEAYRICFAPDKVHDFLYASDLFIGEGTTMAMEAAILGTPSIYINILQYANCNDLVRYGLLNSFTSFNDVLSKIHEFSKINNLKELYKIQKYKLLKDKIDLTSFLIWFIENYPDSVEQAKKADKRFWQRFK